MAENVFLENKKKLSLAEYMNYNPGDRGNLGDELPVIVYRLMEYSMREQLTEEFGEEMQIRIFRSAGYKAGVYFAKKQLDITMPINRFIADLQARMEEMRRSGYSESRALRSRPGPHPYSCRGRGLFRTAPSW